MEHICVKPSRRAKKKFPAAPGRLWVIHGRDVESTRNYHVLIRSDSNGRRWSHPKLMILPREGVRAMSAAIWIDPTRRMCVFWGQSFGAQDGRYGIWAITTDDPDAENPKWSRPRRLGDGIMLNKPTVLSHGDWFFTSSVWKADHSIKVYATSDQGKTFKMRGTAHVLPPETRGPDEPMIVERKEVRCGCWYGGREWRKQLPMTVGRRGQQ
jgi:hypothetical protein